MSINGLRVIFDPHTLEANEERPFAASRHRSKRIRKKLLKRFGGEFRNQPCMWFYCGTVFAHPSFRLSSRQLREVNYEQPNRQPAQGPHRPCALQGTGRAFQSRVGSSNRCPCRLSHVHQGAAGLIWPCLRAAEPVATAPAPTGTRERPAPARLGALELNGAREPAPRLELRTLRRTRSYWQHGVPVRHRPRAVRHRQDGLLHLRHWLFDRHISNAQCHHASALGRRLRSVQGSTVGHNRRLRDRSSPRRRREMFKLHHDTARSREAVLHMHQAWMAARIVKCTTKARTNANPDSASLPIWTQDYSNTVMVRPERKLS
jgi:hypothetical protein